MEVHINNNYVESFVSRYAKENASKVVKYLAIFGIHFLNSINKQNSQLSEMKALAKSIIKSRPNEGKHINHELRVLKDELEKLSKRVATNLGTMVPQQQENSDRLLGSKKQQEDLQQYSLNKSPSLPTKFDPKTLTQKPPTAWRETGDKKSSDRRHRLDNIEEINEPTYEKESRTRVSPSNRERSITPKPNEITHNRIEPRDMRGSLTRHHLDDSEAKDTFKEEGVVYFPRKQKEERYQSGKKETSKDPSQGKSPFFGARRPQIEEHGNAQWSDTRELVSNLTVQSTKSPHFPTMKDDFLCKTPVAGTAQKDKENSRAIMSSATHKGDTRGTKSSVKSSHKPESTHKNKKPIAAAHDKTKKEVKPNKHSHLRASQPLTTTTPNYKNVESKIKDEVNYHKELAKQYKKMKHSLGQSTGFDEDPTMLRGSSRLEPSRDKLGYGDKESMRTTGGYDENARYRASKVLESGTSTAQRSSLTMQQTNPYVEKTSSHHHKSRNDQENLGKNAESHHRDSAGRGGILDIANSFLNSPLMQHISNIDAYMKDPISGQRTPVDMKSSNGFGRSINGVSDIEEDVRLQSSNGFQQSRSSNWGNGAYQPDKSVRSTGSILKDSTNRKYGEKDLRSSCNKDGASSLASSNFSNFLNEDMKGFYQKESLDQKKPKNSGMMVRFGSSENSSNVSFSGNEAPNNAERGDKKLNLNTNPKAQDGFSFDQNVFKNERMTMTQL